MNGVAQRWIAFFFGSPIRALITISAAMLIVSPSAFYAVAVWLINRVLAVAGPLVGPLLALAIAVFGLWVMFWGNRRRRRDRR